MTNVLCVYHNHCADGIGAAWAVHRALGANVDFIAASYGDPPPDVTGRDVLIVDFSYPLATLREMAAVARSVLVLDHHKTAREDLAELLPPIEWKQWIAPGGVDHRLNAIFDMHRSGVGLTWDYLIDGSERSPLVNLIEDRDLWRFKLADSRAFHALLSSYDWTIGQEIEETGHHDVLELMDNWNDVAIDPDDDPFKEWKTLLAEGQAILRAQRKAVAAAVAGTRRTMRIAGCVVPVANVNGAMASEAGNLLTINNEPCPTCKDGSLYPCTDCLGTGIDHAFDIPFSATYYDGADGKRHFSLRSPPGGADVGAIAKTRGGGGHTNAAGFDMPIGWEGE